MDCLFCKIINKEIPSYKIYEDDTIYAFLDIYPENPGDTLIIPKKHYKDLDDIDVDTLNHIFKIAKELKLKLERVLKCDGVILIQNNGIAQEIKHYHLHLNPVYNNKVNRNVEEVYELLK